MPTQEDRISTENKKKKKNIFKILTKTCLAFAGLFLIISVFAVMTKAPERGAKTIADMLNTKFIDDQQYSQTQEQKYNQQRYAQNTKQQNQDRNIYDSILDKDNAYNKFIDGQVQDLTDAMTRRIDPQNMKSLQGPQHRPNNRVMRVTKSVKECIKPNGLIDDEVQECVNGTREKTW
ncbi:hypothetical protein VQ643_09875 [Pseudomonas sp. F1_0610]|uniref:hypothetical protein n=1 Tax=Pseudomonas sp. F1_0610 TaxID=3114284 RepID=UPI0039C38BF4